MPSLCHSFIVNLILVCVTTAASFQSADICYIVRAPTDAAVEIASWM